MKFVTFEGAYVSSITSKLSIDPLIKMRGKRFRIVKFCQLFHLRFFILFQEEGILIILTRVKFVIIGRLNLVVDELKIEKDGKSCHRVKELQLIFI